MTTTKGITYYCIDRDGHIYHRYSAGHSNPNYFWAKITRPQDRAGEKSDVSYSSSTYAADCRAITVCRYTNRVENGRYVLEHVPGWYEVVPVRFLRGRHDLRTIPAEEQIRREALGCEALDDPQREEQLRREMTEACKAR